MTRPTDETLLAFLEGELAEPEREALLEALDSDPALAERLRTAAAGLEAMRSQAAADATEGEPATPAVPSGVSPWWLAVAAAATLALAVPVTWTLARRGDAVAGPAAVAERAAPEPAGSPVPDPARPSYVLVIHGLWPDAGDVNEQEAQRRARAYWEWTRELAERGLLIAAGNLRWEPGERIGPGGAAMTVAAEELADPGFVVGMYALRVDSYDEALAVAAESPHLRYGGRISVRRVGAGFVTVAGMGDWDQGRPRP